MQAQQRFRQRQRERTQQKQLELETKMAEIDALDLENAALQTRIEQFSTLLAVREAFAAVFYQGEGQVASQEVTGTDDSSQEQQRAGEPINDRAKRALEAAQEKGTAPMDADTAGESTASDGEDEPMEDIPATPQKEAVNTKALQIALSLSTVPKFVDYWRRWEVELRFAVMDAREADYSAETVKKVEDVFGFMVYVWSYNVKYFPENFRLSAAAMSPPPEAGPVPQWKNAAAAVVGRMTQPMLRSLRKTWRAYLKQIQDAEDEHLQQAMLLSPTAGSGQLSKGMDSSASGAIEQAQTSMQLLSSAYHMNTLMEAQWSASMALCVGWFTVRNVLGLDFSPAYMFSLHSGPRYLTVACWQQEDMLAYTSHTLRLASEVVGLVLNFLFSILIPADAGPCERFYCSH